MKKFFFRAMMLAVVMGAVTSCFDGGDGGEDKVYTVESAAHELSSGVVMIYEMGYYEIQAGGVSMYFSNLSAEGDDLDNLTFDEDSIVVAGGFGTGFFFSTDGLIATNAHVAAPTIDPDYVKKIMVSVFAVVASEYEAELNQANDQVHQYQTAIMAGYDCRAEYEEAVANRDELQDMISTFRNLSSIPMDLYRHTVKLGIATTGSILTGDEDFKECVLIDSDDENDVAIIQLKSKKTPDDCHVFVLDSPDANYGGGEGSQSYGELMMISYNNGDDEMNLTNEGIKPQVKAGKFTQDHDNKIMYDIAALHGSSGSPVFKADGGKVVAINSRVFGVTGGNDNPETFTGGVKVKYLWNMMKKHNLKNKTRNSVDDE